MPEGQEGIFCVDSYSQSYFRKVSLSTGAKRYPFKKDDQVPICKAHRPTPETLLKFILLNSTIPQQAEKSNTVDGKRRKNQERFYLDFLRHFG